MTHLSTCLREGAQTAHTAAENTAFMKCLLQEIVPQDPLRRLLANLYGVYSALEAALYYHRQDPAVSAIYFPELNRADALARDLAFHYGKELRSHPQPSPAGQAYRDRIRLVSATDPILLIAHSYTRYLGDLSGGQGLKAILRNALNLPPNQGTDLYEFPQIPTPEAKRAFKDHYRQALDSLSLDRATLDRIVAEANRAFDLNRAMLQELEPDVKAALGEDAFEDLISQDRPGSTQQSGHPPQPALTHA